jgi:hypothetical protein
MAQLARPDPARNVSAADYAMSGTVEEAVPIGQAGQPDHAAASYLGIEQIPGWTVVTAALVPVVLVTGWVVGGALQPASYSPVQQTMSVLAGHTGVDPWIMTGALFVVGGCQIATGVGVAGVRAAAGMLLILTGLSTFGVALSPEPAAGPTPLHLAFAVGCVVTTAIWPAFVARRAPAPSWILSVYSCAFTIAIFAVLCGWLLIQTQRGADLGLVERVTSTAQGLFPVLVIVALLQTTRQARAGESYDEEPALSPWVPAARGDFHDRD